eukprot:GEMP01007774.1.p1 GENE.GEMP01007774.1~~GEMP01007774.1.p1  ORF type:complete len:878 (+),score=114.76 GEMP01007774.1:252-2636(+)
MFFETLLYTIFMFLFTAFAYSMQSPEIIAMRTRQKNYWGGCTAANECKLQQVQDQRSFWHWLQSDFATIAYTPEADYNLGVATLKTKFLKNGFDISWSPRFITDDTNILLGSIRVRQVRGKVNQDCEPGALYRHIFPDCYPGFTSASEDREPYGHAYTPTYLQTPHFQWHNESETLGIPLNGNVTEYAASGYYFDMPLHYRESQTLLRDLNEWNWVDQQTRAVIIEFNVLNLNVNILTNNRIAFEFSPSGLVRPLHSMQVWSLNTLTFSTTGDGLIIFLWIIVSFIILFTATIYILWQIWRIRFHFFTYGWNIMDLFIVVLMYVYLSVRISIYGGVANEPNLQADKVGHPEVFHPFSKVAMNASIAAPKILSITVLLVWIKFSKYLCLNGHFRPFLRVFRRCAKELMVFLMILVVLFFGFAVAFHIAFGDEQDIFATLESSSLVLYFFLLGGFRVNYQEWFAPGAGDSSRPLLFLLFFFLVYFICFNIFMAIVLDAYTMVEILHHEPSDGQKNPMIVFLISYYFSIKGITFVTDADMQEPEVQSIELRLLPGLVRSKWAEKKKRMQVFGSPTKGQKDGQTKGGDEDKPGIASTLARWKAAAAAKILPVSALEARKMGDLPPKKQPRTNMYAVDTLSPHDEITITQLQRLLNDDLTIRLLLGASKAAEVIRRFKFKDADDDEEVGVLQNSVLHKLDLLEKSGLEMEARQVPQIREISDSLDGIYSEIQNRWRAEVTSVLELASMLSEGLIQLTKNLERVAENHRLVLDTLGGSSEGSSSSWESSTDTTSSSSTSA